VFGGLIMDITKVAINGTDIPILGSTFRLVNVGDKASLEVELDVHPTVVNFLYTLNFKEEKITITTSQNEEMSGTFEIHLGISRILLIGKLKEVEGIEPIYSFHNLNKPLPLRQEEQLTLENELKNNQKSLQISIIKSLLDNEILDQGNRMFVQILLKKLIKGEELNRFDQFIMDEIHYLVDEAWNKKDE
jgi:hypothetical protein